MMIIIKEYFIIIYVFIYSINIIYNNIYLYI